MWVTECWQRLPTEAVESLPLEIIKKKKSLDMVLGNLFKMALLEKGVGPDDFQRSPANLKHSPLLCKTSLHPKFILFFYPKATAGFNLQLNAILSFLIIFFSKRMKSMYPNPIPNAVHVLFLKNVIPLQFHVSSWILSSRLFPPGAAV